MTQTFYMWCWQKTLSHNKTKWDFRLNSTIPKGSFQNQNPSECLIQEKLPSFSLKDIFLKTWISFSQLRVLSERSVKAAALYTINSQTVTQITCHPYQSLHIELLYLLPAGSPLYLGNITMDLFSASAQNLTIPSVSKSIWSSTTPLIPYSHWAGFVPTAMQKVSLPFLGAHLRANFHGMHMLYHPYKDVSWDLWLFLSILPCF